MLPLTMLPQHSAPDPRRAVGYEHPPVRVWLCYSGSSSFTIFLHPAASSVPGDPADTDYTAVGCAITTISSNLTEMSKGVKLLAALMDDEVGSGEDLLRAARTLAGAVSDLLKAVQPTSGEVSSPVQRRRLHPVGMLGSSLPHCPLHPYRARSPMVALIVIKIDTNTVVQP